MPLNHTIVTDPATGRFDSRNPFGRFEVLPAKITGLAFVSRTLTSITISWNADAVADTYNVYVNSTTTPYATGETGTSTTITGLSSDSSFQIRVSGVNSAGEGPLSDAVTMTTSQTTVGGGTGDLSVLKAFPTAEGGGAMSVGGRGGTVIYVTNLNDSGLGSLRAAVDASGPRIVVFRVSGTIALQTPLFIWNPYITIAGQTAPGGGIQITSAAGFQVGSYLRIHTHNVVVRYLRFRGGVGKTTVNGASISFLSSGGGNPHSIVLDHCSSFWHEGKNWEAWGYNTTSPRNSSIQYCLFAEPIDRHVNVLAGSDDGNFALTMENLDFHNNLLANASYRMPLLKHASSRWVNNLVYNWKRIGSNIGGGIHIDWIGNIHKLGPTPKDAGRDAELIVFPQGGDLRLINRNPSIYISGNKGPWWTNPENNSWVQVRQSERENLAYIGPAPTNWQRFSELPNAGVQINVKHTDVLESALLPEVGVSRRLGNDGVGWVDARDFHEARTVNHYINNTGQAIITGESEVGGLTSIAASASYQSSANDGISDAWKTRNGLLTNTRYNTGPGGTAQVGPVITQSHFPGNPGWTYIDLFLAGADLP
jgi:hypothetical protein